MTETLVDMPIAEQVSQEITARLSPIRAATDEGDIIKKGNGLEVQLFPDAYSGVRFIIQDFGDNPELESLFRAEIDRTAKMQDYGNRRVVRITRGIRITHGHANLFETVGTIRWSRTENNFEGDRLGDEETDQLGLKLLQALER